MAVGGPGVNQWEARTVCVVNYEHTNTNMVGHLYMYIKRMVSGKKTGSMGQIAMNIHVKRRTKILEDFLCLDEMYIELIYRICTYTYDIIYVMCVLRS